MKLLKLLLLWVVVIIVFLIAIVAASYNSESVTLTFLDWNTPEMPISFWMLGAFALGVVLTSLVNTWANTRLRLQTRNAYKSVDRANQDIDRMKAENQLPIAAD